MAAGGTHLFTQEDKLVVELVGTYGTKAWAVIAQELHENHGFCPKSGKQCRER